MEESKIEYGIYTIRIDFTTDFKIAKRIFDIIKQKANQTLNKNNIKGLRNTVYLFSPNGKLLDEMNINRQD